MAKAIVLVALLVVATFIVIAGSRPSLCEPSRENVGEVWAYRVWSTITRADLYCVPWKDRKFPLLTTPIAFEQWYTSVGGPVRQRFYIAPDGTGYIENGSNETPLSNRPAGSDSEGNFRFNDIRAYRRINELVSPLREYSYAKDFGNDLGSIQTKKLKIPCIHSSNYSSFQIYWSGNFNDDRNVSFFENPTDRCQSLKDAMRRINRARRILELKFDPSFRNRLMRGRNP